MRRFYSPQPLTATTVSLEGQVARHMLQVLRMQAGDELEVFDGTASFKARLLASSSKKQACLELLESLPRQARSPLFTHLGQAISKGDRMDWVMQKATELGVNEITPLYTQQGDVRLKGEREAKKHQHWEQVAISACEQSGRDYLPRINKPEPLAAWLKKREEAVKLVLHPGGHKAELKALQPVSAALLIGPEGGMSATEVDQARAEGFQALSLGPRILRTETAPVVALSLLQDWWGDF
ncbi:16S rRNA m(3)U-1498 methyltransferase [Marinospirillum celere]|uniref:Ribosomal RNA small subunit methyltransferase E n=1 Tax=Marinospirillum celere TaxID=1122252 RepID=A0A1I1I8X4_9GAMM|nr:16S rRNA (uracil(1498)-N(3))-methyltransferase [Marinospirillum celere]SFC32485.1 16S rRNA m(3)U-1498 methyltransferase [Marinospirillum celere]